MIPFITKIVPKTHLLLFRPQGYQVVSFGFQWPSLAQRKGTRIMAQEYVGQVGDDRRSMLVQIRTDLAPKREDNIYLGLPLDCFSLLEFTLPRAAEENLEQAVAYALMRHVPMDLDSLYYHFQSTAQGDALSISAVVAPKQRLQPFLEEVASAGLTLSGVLPSLALLAWSRQSPGIYLSQCPGGDWVEQSLAVPGDQDDVLAWEVLAWDEGHIAYQGFEPTSGKKGLHQVLQQAGENLANLGRPLNEAFVWGGQEAVRDSSALGDGLEALKVTDLGFDFPLISPGRDFPYLIDLIPRAVLRQRKLAFAFQVAMFVFFLFSLLSYPVGKVMGLKARVKRLSQEVARVRVQANELSGLRQENEQIKAFFKATLQEVGSRPDLCEILQELTEILPANTWLQSFSFSKGWIRVEGETKSATTVVELIERSPLFKNASFDSPVSKRGAVEVFKIVAQVER